MKIDSEQLIALAGIIKAAQEKDDEKEDKKPKKRKRKKPVYSAAYPSYSRSLVTQFTPDPGKAGLTRGLGTGALGAILGALATRLITKKPALVGGGAAAGGLLGAIPGYLSGKREAESEKSRLLFLRRLGISRPGELEALARYPSAADLVLEKEPI
jgi:hypothetical protein